MTAEKQKKVRIKAQAYDATVTKLERANDRITYYELSFEAEQPFKMIAGQFAMLTMPHEPKPVRRAYSIASTPSEAAESKILLCITAVEGGLMSNWMHVKNIGDVVKMRLDDLVTEAEALRGYITSA